MQLRERLESKPETLSDFAIAADQKYWEGLELAVAGRKGAGIYLLGYSAEMILKVAAFRAIGAKPADTVHPYLAPARQWMSLQGITLAHEGYHSVIFWMNYLRARRVAANHPLDKNLDGLLVHHIRRIYFIWWVEMRYRPDEARIVETERLVDDVNWLRENQKRLWS